MKQSGECVAVPLNGLRKFGGEQRIALRVPIEFPFGVARLQIPAVPTGVRYQLKVRMPGECRVMQFIREGRRAVVPGMSESQACKRSIYVPCPKPRKTLKCHSAYRALEGAQRRAPRHANPANAVFSCLFQANVPETRQHMDVLVTVHMGKPSWVGAIFSAEQQLVPNLFADRGLHRPPLQKQLPYQVLPIGDDPAIG